MEAQRGQPPMQARRPENSMIEYRFTPQEEQFRADVREFFRRELPPGYWRLQNDRDEETPQQQAFGADFLHRLAERGWLTLAWPTRYGGIGAGHMQHSWS